MSDDIIEFIEAPVVVYRDDEIEARKDLKKRARAALDAEREEHERVKCRLREAVLLLKDKGVSAETLERLSD